MITTADTICHICGIRRGDEGSSICSAAHGDRFWNERSNAAMAKAVEAWERQTSREYSTDGLEEHMVASGESKPFGKKGVEDDKAS